MTSVWIHALLILLAYPAGARQQRVPRHFERTGVFQSPRVTESSGVAASRRHPGILWTHNDSGDGPYLYAFDLTGRDRGTFRVTGAAAVDWEDLALERCPDDPGFCLYIADTGDNLERRPHVTIYAVPEPDVLPPDGDTQVRPTAPARAIQVRYPDGPKDVEAMWVAGDGRAMLVSKGMSGRVLSYAVPLRGELPDTVRATLLDTLPLVPQPLIGRMVTGAASAPAGDKVVLRTYTELHFYQVREGRLIPDGPPCWLGLREPQGEGVDFLDPDSLVLTSEAGPQGGEGAIHLVRC